MVDFNFCCNRTPILLIPIQIPIAIEKDTELVGTRLNLVNVMLTKIHILDV